MIADFLREMTARSLESMATTECLTFAPFEFPACHCVGKCSSLTSNTCAVVTSEVPCTRCTETSVLITLVVQTFRRLAFRVTVVTVPSG